MTSLESAGTLTLNGSAVTLNQVISKADIDSGLLTFAPATDANGTGYDSFDFEVHDGTEYSASSYSMTVGRHCGAGRADGWQPDRHDCRGHCPHLHGGELQLRRRRR